MKIVIPSVRIIYNQNRVLLGTRNNKWDIAAELGVSGSKHIEVLYCLIYLSYNLFDNLFIKQNPLIIK